MNFTLNEVKTAEKIIDGSTSFAKEKASKDVMLLARYYKQRTDKTKPEIIETLITYLTEHKIEITDYWNGLIKHCVANAEKFPLSEINNVPVTEMEINKIEELGDDNLERLAFTMLVLSKFAHEKAVRNGNPNADYWFFAQYKEILDKSNIKIGRDKGKEGKVLEVSPSEGKVIVEGCNIATKHAKPRKMGEQGGLLQVETAIYASKVMLVCPKCGKAHLTQDPDTLDTWFSSALWPFSTMGWPHNTPMLKQFYPTSVLVTGYDIIFFWVARMIMAGYEYMGEMPFKHVYFTGIVRDKLGRKMSKSLGNSPDPLDLIARFGADGVRMGMMLSAPAGNDILFDDALCEQGRNFNNKIWNSFRLVQGWAVDKNIEQPEAAKKACEWFDALVKKTGYELQDLFSKYRLSEALMAVYKLYWDEFSAWYLELVKPAFGQPIDAVTYEKTIGYFDTLLKMLHPYMPFITEELWQNITERKDGDSIMFATLPKYTEPTADEEKLIAQFEAAKEIIANIRTIRAQKQMSPKEAVELDVVGQNPLEALASIITKAANTSDIKCVTEKNGVCASFMVGTTEYAVPLGDSINVEEELKKLEADLKYQEGFLQSVMKKLSNKKFVNGAPAQVVANEQNKKATAESKIAALKEAIAALKG